MRLRVVSATLVLPLDGERRLMAYPLAPVEGIHQPRKPSASGGRLCSYPGHTDTRPGADSIRQLGEAGGDMRGPSDCVTVGRQTAGSTTVYACRGNRRRGGCRMFAVFGCVTLRNPGYGRNNPDEGIRRCNSTRMSAMFG